MAKTKFARIVAVAGSCRIRRCAIWPACSFICWRPSPDSWVPAAHAR